MSPSSFQTFMYCVHRKDTGVRKELIGGDAPKLMTAESEDDARMKITARLAKAGDYDPDDMAKDVEIEILCPLAGQQQRK